jgi:putative mRNA 3-end processing factor
VRALMNAVELRRGGLHLCGTALAFDAPRKSELSFVSHAHSDHIARHERVIATAATLRLMAHRLGKVNAPLPVPYNRPFELGPLNLELLPAGHILGSAQLRVILGNGHRVVYTGDINLQRSFTAEPIQVAETDTLVIESTFGHPRFAFPPRDEVFGEVEAWVKQNLEAGIPPVLLGYPLGKSQEAIKYLGDRGYAVCAHPNVHAISEIYREHGVPLKARLFDGRFLPGEVGVFPPFGRSQALKRTWPRATAVLTGWAVEPGTARRYGADRAFAVSDHADFASLLRYAKATGARDVITHHGYARELAEALRGEGLAARAIGKPLQLELFGKAA